MKATDKLFAGSIPALYDHYLGPLIFAPYAADLAARTAALRPARVLETAAGTGIVTRALRQALPATTEIVATDLNQPMLDYAATVATLSNTVWQQADAQALPFEDARFDAVVCQFGVMFFSDKRTAYREARRVLTPSGTFLFAVWDRIEQNLFANVVTQAISALYPADPPRFLARTPHGHFDVNPIESDLRAAGFDDIHVATVEHTSRAPDARNVAIAYCQGTPLRNEIEQRAPGRLEELTQIATDAIAVRFGAGAIEGKIQAIVFEAR